MKDWLYQIGIGETWQRDILWDMENGISMDTDWRGNEIVVPHRIKSFRLKVGIANGLQLVYRTPAQHVTRTLQTAKNPSIYTFLP